MEPLMRVLQTPHRLSFERIHYKVLVAALFALIGVLIFAQFRSEGALRSVRVAASGTDRAALISGLVDANLKLREEAEDLQTKLSELDRQGGSLVVMVGELNRLRLVNGLSEVSGAGIMLILDSPMSATELQDVVNEVKNSGAGAISLNSQRLIAQSAIISTDAGITVDGTWITRPFIFQILGDPSTLRAALMRKGGLLASLEAAHPGFQAQLDELDDLTIPIYSSKIEWRYAQAASPRP
jgi:uncharacterized protein YlxW (UPF0749 family)